MIGDCCENIRKAQFKNKQAFSGEISAENPLKPSNDEIVLQESLKRMKIDLEEVKLRLAMVAREELALSQAIELERIKLQPICEWMNAMQGVIWPSNPEDLDIGRPLEPISIKHQGVSLGSFDEFSSNNLNLRNGLLSVGMTRAAKAADALGIQQVEDVVSIFEGFKWMSWANICLHVLRRPAPTRALRSLIESANSLKMVDEKILKFLNGVYSRGWYEGQRYYI